MKKGAPAEVVGTLPRAQLVGSGALRFFGLSIYEARLWAAPGFAIDSYASAAFALEVEYFRALPGPSIAERSLAEMRRVGAFDPATGEAWLAMMMRAFPDIAKGDRLTGAHDGAGGVRFFHNARPTAALTDARYAELFFGIWLAPQTSSPALRQALSGTAALAAAQAQ